MTTPTLPRRFLRLTALNVLTNVTVPLAGVVDTAILGHLPEIRFLAGVALGGVVFDVLYWSFGVLRMGATGLTAQASGREDPREVERVLRRFLLLAAGAGGLILLLQAPLGDAAFALLAGEPEVEAAAREYFGARIWGAPAVLLNLVFLGWFLGREESRLALAMAAVASASNILLDYLFIVELGWAARGAGLATMISQYLMLALAVGLYLPRRHRAAGGPRELLARSSLASLLRLQTDLVIRTLCLVGSLALFTDLSALLGTQILAANALLLRILTFAAYFIDGGAFATESLAGVFHGARRPGELRRLLRLALGFGAVCGALFAAAVVLFPSAVLGILTSHREVVALAADLRFWLAATLIPGSAAYIYDGFFLGLTAGRPLRNAMLLATVGVYLPLAGVAVAAGSVHLLWLALAAFMVARAVTLGWAVDGLPVFDRKPAPTEAAG